MRIFSFEFLNRLVSAMFFPTVIDMSTNNGKVHWFGFILTTVVIGNSIRRHGRQAIEGTESPGKGADK